MSAEPTRTPRVSDMTWDEARASVAQAKRSLTWAAECVVAQVEGRAWLALGYQDWPTMREAEYGDAAFIVKGPDRKALVRRLRAVGLTQQQIADTVGVSEGAVRLDLNRSSTDQPDLISSSANEDQPATITNARGQERPATYQHREPNFSPDNSTVHPDHIKPEPDEPERDPDLPPPLTAEERAERARLARIDGRVSKSLYAATRWLDDAVKTLSEDLFPRLDREEPRGYDLHQRQNTNGMCTMLDQLQASSQMLTTLLVRLRGGQITDDDLSRLLGDTPDGATS